MLEKHVGFSKNLFPLFATLLIFATPLKEKRKDFIEINNIIDNFIEKNIIDNFIEINNNERKKIIYFEIQ